MQCGFTPQYKELGELYNRYSGKGLVVLGFPCNQFGAGPTSGYAAISELMPCFREHFELHPGLDVGENI